jgi:CTP-dependent riboflavin kinase
LALKSLAIDDIDYAILKAAILGDTVQRIARKTRLSETTTRMHLMLLEKSGKIGKIRRRAGCYYFVKEKGERFIQRYEPTLSTGELEVAEVLLPSLSSAE